VAVFLAGGLFFAAVVGPVAPAQAAPAGIAWHSCPDDPAADCGRLGVPIDTDHPEQGTLSLSVKRYAASAPKSQRLGVLVYNPGGPGLSAVDALQAFKAGVGPVLAARFDLVAVDPRGVGESVITCDGSGAPALGFTVMPTTRDQLIEQMKVLDPWLRESCVASGLLSRHMGTIDNARDLEALRRALGESQVTYYGSSYGSILGLAFAKLFPRSVRALIFDGAVDPRALSSAPGTRRDTLWTRVGAAASGQDAFWSSVVRCESLGVNGCAEATRIRPAYNFLVDYLFKRSLEISGYGDFDSSALQNSVVNLLYHFNEYGIDDYELLFAQIVGLADLAGASETPSSAQSRRAVSLDLELLRATATSTPFGAGTVPRQDPSARLALVDSIVCSETAEPLTVKDMIQDAEGSDRNTPGFGEYWSSTLSACVGWSRVTPALANVLRDLRLAVPLLVLANDHDPVTGLAGARAASRTSRQGQLLEVTGSWGHGVMGRSACADAARDRFAVTLDQPTVRTCPVDIALFS